MSEKKQAAAVLMKSHWPDLLSRWTQGFVFNLKEEDTKKVLTLIWYEILFAFFSPTSVNTIKVTLWLPINCLKSLRRGHCTFFQPSSSLKPPPPPCPPPPSLIRTCAAVHTRTPFFLSSLMLLLLLPLMLLRLLIEWKWCILWIISFLIGVISISSIHCSMRIVSKLKVPFLIIRSFAKTRKVPL